MEANRDPVETRMVERSQFVYGLETILSSIASKEPLFPGCRSAFIRFYFHPFPGEGHRRVHVVKQGQRKRNWVGVQCTACVAYAKQAYIGYKIEKNARGIQSEMPKRKGTRRVGLVESITSNGE
ncbi:hypothetical protein RJ640_029060 [Escallonia rubra]|uniref:Uncharacterized protein n=1 Tax=Escallonia rubra TaxID=112253 RepID=A0AA88UVG7_9ASTE|nr:hypothetical protein RJ640_029060 [Escallonia rubra]